MSALAQLVRRIVAALAGTATMGTTTERALREEQWWQ